MNTKRCFNVAVVLFLSAVFAAPAFGKGIKKVIRNPSGQTANDLTVTTTGGPNNTTNTYNTGNGIFNPKSKSGGAGIFVLHWPIGSGSIPPGGSIGVAVNTGPNGEIDDKNTYLTYNNNPLIIDPCTCGCGNNCCSCLWLTDGNNNQKFVQAGGDHSITIVNNEPVPVTYQNAQVWIGNDNSIGQVDSLETFDIPTGSMSALIPPIIHIDAFQDTTFLLEPYVAGTYDLFLADQANDCPGGVMLPMAAADVPSVQAIPTLTEIGVILLVVFLMGFGILVTVRRHKCPADAA